MSHPTITYEQFKEALKVIHQYKTHIDALQKEVSRQMKEFSQFINFNEETNLIESHEETYFAQLDVSKRLSHSIIRYYENYHGLEIKFDTKLKEFNLKPMEVSLKLFSALRDVGQLTIEELKTFCAHSNVIKLIP